MRRITFWAMSTVSAVALLFGYSTSTSGPITSASGAAQSGAVVSSSLNGSGSATTQSSGSDQTASGGAGTDPTPSTTSGSSVAKTITGSVASTRWGPVQVQLVVKGGKITQVSVLQYPSGNGTDAEINSYALPILTDETISAQSATIEMVSGATVTSEGYLSSLQSAIDQAQL